MLNELYFGCRSVPNLKFGQNWDVLQQIYNLNRDLFGSITFDKVEDPRDGICWRIKESVADGNFLMQRSCITKQRNTIEDTYGLLGLSLIDPKDDSVILTEGVSDFFTAKFLEPTRNVLGVTTLSGSVTAKKLILSLFNKILICSDNDALAERNTGITNSAAMRKFYSNYLKSVTIFTPQPGFKDITDNLIFNLKISNYA